MIRPEFNKYFNSNYIMQPEGENGILFTAEYVALTKNTIDALADSSVVTAMKSQYNSDGILQSIPDEPFSHDNQTAMVCLSKMIGWTYHKTFFHKDWWRRIQPWNVIFYIYCMGGIQKLFIYPFLPILSLKMIFDVSVDTHKTINETEILATDDKLLTYLRLYSVDFPITKFVCNNVMKFRKRHWYDYFFLYFGPIHPNTQLAVEKGA